MRQETAQVDSSKNFSIPSVALWVLKCLVALVFLLAAGAKLSGQAMMIQEFNLVGLGQWFRILTGLVEIAGAALLLSPRTSRAGAMTLVIVCVGALAAQIMKIHGDLIHVFVLLALTSFLAWKGESRPVFLARVAT